MTSTHIFWYLKGQAYDSKKKDYENPYDGQCAILYAMNLIGAKWKIPILWHLTHYGILHYNELKRRLGGVTNTVLARN